MQQEAAQDQTYLHQPGSKQAYSGSNSSIKQAWQRFVTGSSTKATVAGTKLADRHLQGRSTGSSHDKKQISVEWYRLGVGCL